MVIEIYFTRITLAEKRGAGGGEGLKKNGGRTQFTFFDRKHLETIFLGKKMVKKNGEYGQGIN